MTESTGWLELVEITDPEVLGGAVRLALTKRAILFGKNGSGKSAILSGIAAAAWETVIPGSRARSPPQWAAEARLKSGEAVRYEREQVEDESTAQGTDGEIEDAPQAIIERCLRTSDGFEYWSLRQGIATLSDGSQVVLARGSSLIGAATESSPGSEAIQVAGELNELFSGVRLIQAGVPRHTTNRQEVIFIRTRPTRTRNDRVEALARRIAYLFDAVRLIFNEFEELGRSIGIWNNVDVTKFKNKPATDSETTQELVTVSVDGVNFGLLSDGTLRVAEILLVLVNPVQSLLLLEEPETAIHPSLLRRLLSVIESYTIDSQVIISTHSSIVVNWANPSDLTLIERDSGTTKARNLQPDEMHAASRFIDDEGTLSDFVFSRWNK